MRDLTTSANRYDTTIIHGARCAVGPNECVRGSVEIVGGRLRHIFDSQPQSSATSIEINLDGFLLMTGLINAHDHLEFALHPRLGNPPYQNYIEWGEDIHDTLPHVIAMYKLVPRHVRLWWGVIRNLLCGVTTVCHHGELWPELQREDFPLRVVQQYGWAHSLALGGDLRQAHSATAEGRPFIVHACEGVDDLARRELIGLDRIGVLNANTVLVHGLMVDGAGAALLHERGASLIICPSSNHFLFGKLPDIDLLSAVKNMALGNDSPLTATGDLLDEIRFAIENCGIAPDKIYHMVTEIAAAILRLGKGEGTMQTSGVADLIAIRDTGDNAANRLRMLSFVDVEFVMVGGQIQLASEIVWERLSPQMRQGLEPLWIEGNIRWLRAPVKGLLQKTEAALGPGKVQLGGHPIRIPDMGVDTNNGGNRVSNMYVGLGGT